MLPGSTSPDVLSRPSSNQREEACFDCCPGHLVSALCDWNSLSLTRWHFFSLSARKCHQALHPVGWAGAKTTREGGVGPQAAWMVTVALGACWSRWCCEGVGVSLLPVLVWILSSVWGEERPDTRVSVGLVAGQKRGAWAKEERLGRGRCGVWLETPVGVQWARLA